MRHRLEVGLNVQFSDEPRVMPLGRQVEVPDDALNHLTLCRA